MNLLALSAFADNYIWMIHDGQQALVVDPGDSAPVLRTLDALGLSLAGILVTHHHSDHVGGLAALLPRLRGTVYGPAREPMPVPCQPVHDGDHISVMGLGFAVIDVPGHTAGHVAYFQTPRPAAASEPTLFCGDTLFSAGCGRLFEGTPAQMHQSLLRLSALPGNTRVCCAHEYTLSNLRFAQAVEPSNSQIAAHTQHCAALRTAGLPTLPSTIAQEQRINPFLRCHEPAVIQTAQAHGATSASGTDVFAALRLWKNHF
jgi:hydroxyacylglutathione hydrolase